MVEEVESPGSMALSVESCVWSRVCRGLVGGGDGETSSLGLVGEGEEVLMVVVVVGELLVAVTVAVQVRSDLALLVMEAGGL